MEYDVEILLSTYNGEKYLDEFLTSIEAQDYKAWHMTIRDDGSSDGTRDIIRAWREKLPDQIIFLDEEDIRNLGFLGSFSYLLTRSTAPYVMFADQDDIWLPAKISSTFSAMRGRESEKGVARPIVVHTDAVLVDEQLRPTGSSAWQSQGQLWAGPPSFARVLVENVVLGCTIMMNRPLIELVGSVPREAVFHDWWIALVAAALGDMVALPEKLILWRRHGSNESEASNLRSVLLLTLANPLAGHRRLHDVFDAGHPRTRAFLETYRDRLTPGQISAAEAYLELPRRNFLLRRWDILRHNLLFAAPLRNIGMMAFI